MQRMQSLMIEPCLYPSWAHGGHQQTIVGHLLASKVMRQSGQDIVLPLADGDSLQLRYYSGNSDTVVYLFHGLSGDLHSDYMQRTAIVCQKQGHSVVLVNHRGAGQTVARHPYHFGSYQDLAAVFSFGRKNFREKRHGAVGFSMSGNMLLLLLAQEGLAKPDWAIIVNAPIDLAKCAFNLAVGFNRFYDLRFVKRLSKEIAAKGKMGLLERDYKISRFGTLMDLDGVYTAPAAGFINRDDYYTRCSAKRFLSSIGVPTVILTSHDDPIVAWEDYLDAKLSDNIYLHLEKCGGHMGYISKTNTPLGTRRWLDYALSVYFKTLVDS